MKFSATIQMVTNSTVDAALIGSLWRAFETVLIDMTSQFTRQAIKPEPDTARCLVDFYRYEARNVSADKGHLCI